MPTPEQPPQFVLPETRAIAALGLFDLLATVYLIASHKANEANPLFATIMASFGSTGFVVFKALMLAVPLIIAEKARQRSPVFVRRALQVGLIAYVVLLLFAYRANILALFSGSPSQIR